MNKPKRLASVLALLAAFLMLFSVLFIALEADHDFLLKGDVFTTDFLEAYISYKRQNEVDPVRLRPTPYEFVLYFDC